VVQAYLTRWRVEDISVLAYEKLKNMAALVLAAAFFTAVQIGYKPKLQILALHTLSAAQRIFGIPDFPYYALTDSIKAILTKSGHGILPQKRSQGGPNPQLCLSLA
jgi:hypothetical protein